MKELSIFCLFSVAAAYHLPDDIGSVMTKSKVLTKNWMHLPVIRGSEEYQYLGDLADLPTPTKGLNHEKYQWVEDDIVARSNFDALADDLLEFSGGCELTETQYRRLQNFRKENDYVQKCYCQDGSVYCKLKKNGEHLQVT